MNTIKLNNTEFTVSSYSRTTNFSGEGLNSYAYAMIDVPDAAALNAIAAEPVTSLQIFHNDTLIYDLGEINAHIDSINDSATAKSNQWKR